MAGMGSMKRIAAIVASGFLSTAGLVHAVSPSTAQSLGLDVWNILEESERLEAARNRERELDDFQDRLCRATELSRRVVAEYVDGRLSLAETLEALEVINSNRPEFHEILEFYYPWAKTRPARVMQYIVVQARAMLSGDPSRLAEVEGRIDCQWREMDGTAGQAN